MTTGSGTRDLLTALGLVLVIEGALYALAPGAMKRMFEAARSMDEAAFRVAGAAAVAIGFAVVWWVRR